MTTLFYCVSRVSYLRMAAPFRPEGSGSQSDEPAGSVPLSLTLLRGLYFVGRYVASSTALDQRRWRYSVAHSVGPTPLAHVVCPPAAIQPDSGRFVKCPGIGIAEGKHTTPAGSDVL